MPALTCTQLFDQDGNEPCEAHSGAHPADIRRRRGLCSDRAHRAVVVAAQALCAEQLGYLLRDVRHPSLRAKKYDEARGIWQARVTLNWRFYFTIEGDTYTLLTIRSHPK